MYFCFVQKTWKHIMQEKSGKLKSNAGLPESINDVRDKYFNNDRLNEEERTALDRYDAYRIWYLNSAPGEWEFHKRYEELQAKANLSHYQEFLEKKYDVPDNN